MNGLPRGSAPVTRRSGSPTKAAPASQTATAAQGCIAWRHGQAGTKHLIWRVLSFPRAPRCSPSLCVGSGLPSVLPGLLERAAHPSPCHGTGLVAITHRASQHPNGTCSLSPSHANRFPCLSLAPLEGASIHSPHHAPSTHGLQKTCPVHGNTSPPQASGKITNKKTKESILPKQCLRKSLSFSFFLEVV